MSKGWKGDRYEHGLASKGVRTRDIARGNNKLRYEGYASTGDEIRAYDFAPVIDLDRGVSFIQGVVVNDNARMPSQPDARAYEIKLTRKVFGGKDIEGIEGDTFFIPFETGGEDLYDKVGINRVSIIKKKGCSKGTLSTRGYNIYESGREKDGAWQFPTKKDAMEWLKTVQINKIDDRYFVREGLRGGTIFSFPTKKGAEKFVDSLYITKE